MMRLVRKPTYEFVERFHNCVGCVFNSNPLTNVVLVGQSTHENVAGSAQLSYLFTIAMLKLLHKYRTETHI